MSAATLTQEQAAALQRLADSPAARLATEQHEQARAERRRGILEQLASDEAAALATLRAAGEVESAARLEVARLQAELRAAVARLGDAARDETNASAALDAAGCRARRELQALGGDAIDEALSAVLWAERRALGNVSFRPVRDPYGAELPPQLVDAALPGQAAQLRALAVELEGLHRAPLAPDVIEGRCAEVRAAIEAGEVPTPTTAKRPSPRLAGWLMCRGATGGRGG